MIDPRKKALECIKSIFKNQVGTHDYKVAFDLRPCMESMCYVDFD